MKINKKMLISLGIVTTAFLILNEPTHAEELKKALEAYLRYSDFDLLGRKYDKILFQNILEPSIKGKQTDTEIIEKLKFVIDDVKTMPLQAKCTFKIVTEKYNSMIYAGTGMLAGAKINMGAKAFNKLLIKVLKVVVK